MTRQRTLGPPTERKAISANNDVAVEVAGNLSGEPDGLCLR